MSGPVSESRILLPMIPENRVVLKAEAVALDRYHEMREAGESDQPAIRGGMWSDKQYVEPPFDFTELGMLLQESGVHLACCEQKSLDTAGIGWELIAAEDVEDPSQSEYDILEAFFKQPNADQGFSEFGQQIMMDFESLGTCAFEVVREKLIEETLAEAKFAGDEDEPEPDGDLDFPARVGKQADEEPGDDADTAYWLGYPVAMYPIPMPTLRIRADRKMYRQQDGFKTAYFRPFGSDPNATDDRGNLIYGDVSDGVRAEEQEIMHEAILLKNYSPISLYYGVPCIIPGILDIKAALYVDWWNLTFFKRNLVPELVVTIRPTTEQGIRPEDLKETKEIIKSYLRNELMGEEHAGLMMTVPWGVEVTFDPLGAEIKDASWRGWRLELQDAILTCHRVPPHRLGIVRGGKTTEGAQAQIETYKTSIINPRREKLEEIFNRIIQEGFGFHDWVFKLKEFDAEDEKVQADTANILTTTGAVSVNDMAEFLGWGRKPADQPIYDLPEKWIEILLPQYAAGKLKGSMIELLAKTGRLMDEPVPPEALAGLGLGIPAATVPTTQKPSTVIDYATGKELKAGPEETIRQDYERKLVEEYGYPKDQLDTEVDVHFGTRIGGVADIVIYKEPEKQTPYIVIELCQSETDEKYNQVESYGNALGSEGIVLYDGSAERVWRKDTSGAWIQAQAMPRAGDVLKRGRVFGRLVNGSRQQSNLLGVGSGCMQRALRERGKTPEKRG